MLRDSHCPTYSERYQVMATKSNHLLWTTLGEAVFVCCMQKKCGKRTAVL
jgi:hypothetical protein